MPPRYYQPGMQEGLQQQSNLIDSLLRPPTNTSLPPWLSGSLDTIAQFLHPSLLGSIAPSVGMTPMPMIVTNPAHRLARQFAHDAPDIYKSLDETPVPITFKTVHDLNDLAGQNVVRPPELFGENMGYDARRMLPDLPTKQAGNTSPVHGVDIEVQSGMLDPYERATLLHEGQHTSLLTDPWALDYIAKAPGPEVRKLRAIRSVNFPAERFEQMKQYPEFFPPEYMRYLADPRMYGGSLGHGAVEAEASRRAIDLGIPSSLVRGVPYPYRGMDWAVPTRLGDLQNFHPSIADQYFNYMALRGSQNAPKNFSFPWLRNAPRP